MALLKVCSQCGKKRLFLFDGICNKCVEENKETRMREEKERREAAKAAAEDLYDRLAQLWSSTGSRWYSIEFDYIFEAERILANCDQFETLLHKIPEYEYFEQVFAARSSIGVSGCYNNDFGTLNVEQVDDKTVKIDFEQLMENINKLRSRIAICMQNTKDFALTFSQLNRVDIRVDEYAEPCEKTSDSYFESKNITSRTRVEKLNPFFAIDVETTGLNPLTDEIISISAVKFLNFEPAEVFTTYVKPRNGLKPRAQEINGITEDDVKDAPYLEQIAAALSDFLTPDQLAKTKPPIVGHNLSFDCKFLHANGIATYCATRNHYDTLELARRQYKYENSYKLDELTKTILHIARPNAHNSLSDALAAGLLFKKICEERLGL